MSGCLHKHIDLFECSSVLEIGCGVGAQIRVLLRRFPHLNVTGVDISDKQIARAHSLLENEVASKKVKLQACPGSELSLPNDSFDAVYICFVLEHAPNPVDIILEAKRVLKKGGVIYCTEVLTMLFLSILRRQRSRSIGEFLMSASGKWAAIPISAYVCAM